MFLEPQRKSIIGNSLAANGIPHSKEKNPPAVSVVTFSADVATLYREQKDPEKMENLEEELSGDFDENSGFAIIINGHSLIHCLTPELEARFVLTLKIYIVRIRSLNGTFHFFSDLLRLHLNARL